MSIKKRQKIVDRFNDPHVGELYFTKVAVFSTTVKSKIMVEAFRPSDDQYFH